MEIQSNSLDKFLSEIQSETEKHKSETIKETKKYISEELEKAEEEALKESYRKIQNSAAEIRKEQGRRISLATAENNSVYLKRREEILDMIVENTKQKLCRFVSSDDYDSFLANSLQEIAKQFKNGNFTVFVGEKDISKSEQIKKRTGCLDVLKDSSIVIGGVKAEDEEHTVCIDDTLDTRIANCREDLYRKIVM